MLPSDLDELRQRLVAAATLYQASGLQSQRKGVIEALSSIADFLEHQNFPPETLGPILRPVLALAERENNNLDLMFSERARGGRPKSSVDALEKAGILASLANFWLEQHQNDGRSQAIKLSEAARKIRGHWFGNVTRANLKSARELVSQEARDHPAVLVAQHFDQILRDSFSLLAADGGHVGPERAFELVIDFVNEAPPSRMTGISKTPPVSPNEKS